MGIRNRHNANEGSMASETQSLRGHRSLVGVAGSRRYSLYPLGMTVHKICRGTRTALQVIHRLDLGELVVGDQGRGPYCQRLIVALETYLRVEGHVKGLIQVAPHGHQTVVA